MGRLLFATIFSLFQLMADIQENAYLAGFKKENIQAHTFTLTTFYKLKEPSETIRIYIEGDGKAWKTKNKLSKDPTPYNPLALKLAILDPSISIAYIARPGQFYKKKCDPKYWSKNRFSPEVVSAMNEVIDQLKKKSNAKNIELIGYSGGAALAIIIAANRIDISSIRTIAGNLNSKALCQHHKVTMLQGMDPIDFAPKISHIPQRHFIGSKDKIIPYFIIESFVKEGKMSPECITKIKNVSHDSGWQEVWKILLQQPTLSN